MKHFILLSALIISTLGVFGQSYKQAVGIRGGWSSGFEYRIYTDEQNSYKFLLSGRDHGFQAHVLKEFHQYDLFDFTDQLVLVYGAGVHVGYERWDVQRYYNNSSWYDTRSSLIAGVDGLVGLEYVFYEVPISAGFEVKPYFDLFGRELFDLGLFDFAFTVKYLF